MTESTGGSLRAHCLGWDFQIQGISALYRSASAAVTIETIAVYLRGGKTPQIQGLHMPIDGSPDLVEQDYVDDTMIFSYGSLINWHKSSGFVVGVDDVCTWGEHQGFTWAAPGQTCRYLGFHVGLEVSPQQQFEPILASIWRELCPAAPLLSPSLAEPSRQQFLVGGSLCPPCPPSTSPRVSPLQQPTPVFLCGSCCPLSVRPPPFLSSPRHCPAGYPLRAYPAAGHTHRHHLQLVWNSWSLGQLPPQLVAFTLLYPQLYLELREKEYDLRVHLDLYTDLHASKPTICGVLVYLASTDKNINKYYLGEASLKDMAWQIARAVGPSGPNAEYLFKLHKCLREIGCEEEELENLVDEVQKALM
ncbi:hypothetical protein L7F22_061464 [Adiantum nelumboides]|nr:hypothetical protein [Adiantum nelumboides]